MLFPWIKSDLGDLAFFVSVIYINIPANTYLFKINNTNTQNTRATSVNFEKQGLLL